MIKLFKCCFLNVEATLMNIRWLKFHFKLTINVEATSGHRRWIDVILPILFQRCFVNVETTSTNIRRLNFHFQPNFNVETTLVYWRWIDVILSTLFCQRWNNVDKCTKAQLSFSTKYQRWCVCWVIPCYSTVILPTSRQLKTLVCLFQCDTQRDNEAMESKDYNCFTH